MEQFAKTVTKLIGYDRMLGEGRVLDLRETIPGERLEDLEEGRGRLT